MATTRAFGMTATTLLDGRILVVAGTEFAALPSAELFDPASGIWTTTGSMHEARSGHTATLLADGRVLVTGGSIVHTSALRTAEIFDPATGAWSTVAPMSAERTGHTSTLLDDGSVLVTGGHLATDDASLTQEFTAYPLGDGPLASAQRFDPATGRWTPAGTMAVGRYGHTATLLSDGTVLVAGGVTADGSTPTAEVFDPVGRHVAPGGRHEPGATRAGRGRAAGRLGARRGRRSGGRPRERGALHPSLGEDRADRVPDPAEAAAAGRRLVAQRLALGDLDRAPAEQPHGGRERRVLDRVDEAGDAGRRADPDRHLQDLAAELGGARRAAPRRRSG